LKEQQEKDNTILILFSEEQLRYVLTEDLKRYHHERIHQGIIAPDSRGYMPPALPSQPSSFSPVLRSTARNVISYTPMDICTLRELLHSCYSPRCVRIQGQT